MKTSMLAGIAIAGCLFAAAAPTIAAGGIAEGTGEGATRADACKAAVEDAENDIYSRETAKITFGKRYEITKKKCDCQKEEDDPTPSYKGDDWSCIAFVTYEFAE